LGKSLENTLEKSNLETYDALVGSVEPLLAKDFLHAKKREELDAAIQSQLSEIRVERKNPLDKIYRMFVQAAETADSILTPKE
jgi:hypothetical protein